MNRPAAHHGLAALTDAGRSASFIAFVVAVSFVTIVFRWDGNLNFNLADEGFLWYGAQRVMQGDVPIRDFMAYDPGRYYWSAALMAIKGGDQLINLRIAANVFQTLGLFVILRVIAAGSNSRLQEVVPSAICAAVTLGLWMTPYYRDFDIVVPVFLISGLAALVQSPRPKRYFLVGIVVGMAAVFGRNHGVYGLIGSVGAMIWLHFAARLGPGLLRGGLLFAGGVIVGFMPILLMAAFIPGFLFSFIDSILDLFRLGTTNLPLPIPWPWTVDFANSSDYVAIRGILVGGFFIAALIFGPVAIVWVTIVKKRGRAVPAAFVACAFLALPYAHYAFSRADVDHLASGIMPTLVGVIVFSAYRSAVPLWTSNILLLVASLWVMGEVHPGWMCRESARCVGVEISGTMMTIDPNTATEIALLRSLANTYATGGRSFVAAPFWPSAYAVLGRKAPMWEIYALFPAREAAELAEVERIKVAKPAFAIINDVALDGREELRFHNTHPIVYKYIHDNGKPIAVEPPSAFQVFQMDKSQP